jgi:hypothetical protein
MFWVRRCGMLTAPAGRPAGTSARPSTRAPDQSRPHSSEEGCTYSKELGRALLEHLRVLRKPDEDGGHARLDRRAEREEALRADEEREEHDGRGVLPVRVVRGVRVAQVQVREQRAQPSDDCAPSAAERSRKGVDARYEPHWSVMPTSESFTIAVTPRSMKRCHVSLAALM